GHLVTLSPVSILRDGASVDRQPFIEVVKGYDPGNRKSIKSKAVANTYEGEDLVLYRVFTQDPKAPVSCIDVVFSKKNSEAT
ncbi:OmpA family protein, partial [Klebsiella pneumoniae]|nr:OmpA family protein [Klebsiella pneumoniae]